MREAHGKLLALAAQHRAATPLGPANVEALKLLLAAMRYNFRIFYSLCSMGLSDVGLWGPRDGRGRGREGLASGVAVELQKILHGCRNKHGGRGGMRAAGLHRTGAYQACAVTTHGSSCPTGAPRSCMGVGARDWGWEAQEDPCRRVS